MTNNGTDYEENLQQFWWWLDWSRVGHFGFKTSRFWNFSIFWMVSDSAWKNLISKKVPDPVSKIFVSEKVLDSASSKFGIGKRFGFGFIHILNILGVVLVVKLLRFGIKKRLVVEKSIGFNIKQNLVSKKLLDSGYHHTLDWRWLNWRCWYIMGG